ncbi:nucleotidyltransferase [Clostridium felsineum]|uniref:nucleotidyltransferase n=1 Tax=Clostridium felsineum TaxID=36839 RepID=UPI00098C5D75|nr:nucleotidyltransferase [Clostridium felsineum]URZ00795.1 tRNA(Met) cytidine acetate ligase [Clostridium felsineum]
MNITGIIAEYNPMHSGHIHHLTKTREICNSDVVVCVMSGNFVQRGEPAIIDKWSRAKSALQSGVDLIIELPCIYAVSSAEFFAFGAVSLLNSLGCISNICFGSESGEIEDINLISKILNDEPNEYKTFLKTYLDKGLSFPLARTNALREYLSLSGKETKHNVLSSANNILGVEYCKSLIKLKSNIVPYTIQRLGNDYNDLELKAVSSASAIRNSLKSKENIEFIKDMLPEKSFEMIIENIDNLTYVDYIFDYIKYKALTSKDSFRHLPDVSEGIENKIYNSMLNSYDMGSLMRLIKNKRYTYSRISRILTQYFIGFDCYNTEVLRKSPPKYARILGFNDKGRDILKLLKKTSSIPLVTKVNNYDFEELSLDIKATKAYSLINKKVGPLDDYYKKIIIV